MISPFASENFGNVMAIIVFGSKLSVGLDGVPGPLVGVTGANKKKTLSMLSIHYDPKKLMV